MIVKLTDKQRKERDKKCKNNSSNFADIVKCYLNSQVLTNEEWGKKTPTQNLIPDSCKEYVKNSKNIEQAIERAVCSRDSNNRCHDHQKRIRKEVYNRFNEKLISKKLKILNCKSFSELIEIGDSISREVKWAGLLFSYDVMLRIAEYLQTTNSGNHILPKKVYIHAHPEKSAKTLFPNQRLSRSIDKCILPKEFKELQPYQCEEVLCLYYDVIVKASKNKWESINGEEHNW